MVVGLIALAGCESVYGTHESRLKTEHLDRSVVPSFARDQSGVAFSGRAYGTLFGETSMDCVEWKGTFVAGYPEGEFLVYSHCNSTPLKVLFKHGTRVAVPNSSFKAKPLRGAA